MVGPRSMRGGAVPIGQRVAHFRIESLLGEGGMGVVYVADDEHLHRKVALKVLHSDVTGNRDRRRRFLREARVAASVTHPSIATVYEVGEEDGRIYIAMELVEGTDLKKLLVQKSRLPVAEALRITREVARGIVKAHDSGIIHRDLKPDNIMIGADEVVKILDFGLAKPREKDAARPDIWSGKGIDNLDDTSSEIATSRWALVGTPAYMSPEQAKGRDVDERSDLFSMGVILYEMLTGRRPFKGETWQEVILSIHRETPPPPSKTSAEITPAIDALVARCLAKEPEQRYANFRELMQAIDEAQGRESVVDSGLRGLPPSSIESSGIQPTAIEPPPATQKFKPPSRTRGVAIAIGAVAATLVVGAAAALIFFKRPTGASPVEPTTTASAAAAPPKEPHAITEFPPPKSDVPAALATYARALQDLRDGSISMAAQELRKAAELDPMLAAAQLRHILYPAIGGSKDERRRYFQNANQLRSSLVERDQLLLKAIEPAILPDAPDREAAVKRMRDVAAKAPSDAEIQLALAQAELDADHHALAVQAADRALALDPKYASAAMMKGVIAMSEGDRSGVLKAAAECIEISPSAGSCFRMRAHVEALDGDAQAIEKDARQMVAVEPNGNLPYFWLARALASNHAPKEAIVEVLDGQANHLAEPLRAEVSGVNHALLDAMVGDFATAASSIMEAQSGLVSKSTESGHASLVTLVQILREAGDPRAAKIAKDFLDKKLAWVADDATGEGVMIAAAARGGELAKDAVGALRTRAIAELKSQLPSGMSNAAWIYAYAWPAETPDEAKEALAAMRSFEPLPSPIALEDFEIAEGMLGKVYFLAGRTDDALPLLKRGVAACLDLTFPIEHTELAYDLGQALEEKGDTQGACGAYKQVLDRWTHPAPRSLTGEKARQRVTALACK